MTSTTAGRRGIEMYPGGHIDAFYGDGHARSPLPPDEYQAEG